MPDGAEVGSVFGSIVRLSKPKIEVDQDPRLQRPWILALPKATIEGTIPMVARKRPDVSDTGSSSTAVAFGRRRSGNGQGRSGVAAHSGNTLAARNGTCVPE